MNTRNIDNFRLQLLLSTTAMITSTTSVLRGSYAKHVARYPKPGDGFISPLVANWRPFSIGGLVKLGPRLYVVFPRCAIGRNTGVVISHSCRRDRIDGPDLDPSLRCRGMDRRDWLPIAPRTCPPVPAIATASALSRRAARRRRWMPKSLRRWRRLLPTGDWATWCSRASTGMTCRTREQTTSQGGRKDNA